MHTECFVRHSSAYIDTVNADFPTPSYRSNLLSEPLRRFTLKVYCYGTFYICTRRIVKRCSGKKTFTAQFF